MANVCEIPDDEVGFVIELAELIGVALDKMEMTYGCSDVRHLFGPILDTLRIADEQITRLKAQCCPPTVPNPPRELSSLSDLLSDKEG
jgi:hypothetical protein